MNIEQYITNEIAPRLQGDGGWVEIDSFEDNKLTLVFRGECSKCLILNRCVSWIEEQIKAELGEAVTVIPVRKKPYFQDV